MKKNDLSPEAFRFEGKMSLKQALPLGMQHVLAMFVGNLTPLLIITGACGLAGGEFADLRVTLLQNAMLVAGIVTLVQLYSIGPIGGKVPIIMGTSSGFIGVFSSVAASMGGGVLAYGAIMGASLIGGLFETVLGFFLKPLRKLLPSVVTGTVVLSIGLSLISVGVNSFGGRKPAARHLCAGRHPDLQALRQHLFEFLLDFGGHHLRLHCSVSHGFYSAHHGAERRGRCLYQGMGAELEQGGRGQMVCIAPADACQTGV